MQSGRHDRGERAYEGTTWPPTPAPEQRENYRETSDFLLLPSFHNQFAISIAWPRSIDVDFHAPPRDPLLSATSPFAAPYNA